MLFNYITLFFLYYTLYNDIFFIYQYTYISYSYITIMKFSKITAISISPSVVPIFESFDTLRPKNTSFSLFLAIALEEYVKSYKKVTSSKHPRIMDRIDLWHDCIKDMSNDDLIKTNKRISQLSNKLRIELESRV